MLGKNITFKLTDLGEKSIASILIASEPLLSGQFDIQFTLPNKLMFRSIRKK